MWVWWLVGALVVVPVVTLGAAAVRLGRRQVQLRRLVAEFQVQGQAQVAAWQPGQERLQAQLAGLARRAEQGRARVAVLADRIPGQRS